MSGMPFMSSDANFKVRPIIQGDDIYVRHPSIDTDKNFVCTLKGVKEAKWVNLIDGGHAIAAITYSCKCYLIYCSGSIDEVPFTDYYRFR